MSGDLHGRAGEVFLEARRLPRAERAAFVRSRCGGDSTLTAEVESLLAHDEGEAVIDTPVPAAQMARALAPEVEGREGAGTAPRRIGRYEILGVLGEGGMGVVYRAAQESPRRVVALKVIRHGSRRPALLRRFEREAEALARLQHPGIAQVFEVGHAETEFGPCPYLAMELVEGVTITEFAERAGLSVRDKLALLARVSDAVHHAHTKGVIHRDLKPGNILVTGGDDSTGRTGDGPAPKILDFGVARLLDDPEATSVTDAGQLVGTIRYMSPEQLSGDSHAADARSDVHALGVIGYELLAGRPPLETTGRPLAEVSRIIREHEPAPLGRVSPDLGGDPEVIIAKALEKDPARRYASAAGMAEDIRRYLSDEPIGARPASVGYQLSKFARRNRALVAAAGVGVGALATVALVSTWAYVVSSRERDAARAARQMAEQREAEAQHARDETARALEQERAAQTAARREADKAVRALEFLRQMLSAADPSREDANVRVATVLDRAGAEVGKAFEGQPESEATVRYALGTAYQALGRDDRAREQLERAVDLRSAALGPDHADTETARLALADVLVHARHAEDALEVLRLLLAGHPTERPDRLTPRVLNVIGQAEILRSKYAEAEAALRGAVETAQRVGIAPSDAASYRANLGLAIEFAGRLEDAEREQDAAVKALEAAWGPRHNLTLTARTQLATLRARMGRIKESIPELEELLQIRREAFGEEHPATLTVASNLGNAYLNTKQYERAVPALKDATEGLAKAVGPEDERAQTAANNLASAYLFTGRFADAEPMYRRVLQNHRKVLGPRHQKTLSTTNNLAKCLQKQGKLEEAEALYRELLPGAIETFPAGHWMIAAFKLGQGQVLKDLKRFEEAEPLLLEALATLSKSLGPKHDYAVVARRDIRALYEAWGKPEEAARIAEPP